MYSNPRPPPRFSVTPRTTGAVTPRITGERPSGYHTSGIPIGHRRGIVVGRNVFRLARRQTERLIGSILALLGLDMAGTETHPEPQGRDAGRGITTTRPGAGAPAGGQHGTEAVRLGRVAARAARHGHAPLGAQAAHRSGRRHWTDGRDEVDTRDVDDASQVGPLLDQAGPVASFTADELMTRMAPRRARQPFYGRCGDRATAFQRRAERHRQRGADTEASWITATKASDVRRGSRKGGKRLPWRSLGMRSWRPASTWSLAGLTREFTTLPRALRGDRGRSRSGAEKMGTHRSHPEGWASAPQRQMPGAPSGRATCGQPLRRLPRFGGVVESVVESQDDGMPVASSDRGLDVVASAAGCPPPKDRSLSTCPDRRRLRRDRSVSVIDHVIKLAKAWLLAQTLTHPRAKVP